MDSKEKDYLNNEETVEDEEMAVDTEETVEEEVRELSDDDVTDVSDDEEIQELPDNEYDGQQDDELSEEAESAEEANEFDYTDTAFENAVQSDEVVQPKKKSAAPVIAVIAVLVVAIAVAAYAVFSDGIGGNKYNKMGYVNVSGRTVQDIADSAGIGLADFLSEYSLPEDMPGDTYEIAAIYNMPAKVYLQTMLGIDDFATVKAELNIPDETTPDNPKTLKDKIQSIFKKDDIQVIDENTPWYIIEGELTVGDYSGGDMESFKTFYDLGDDVTETTKIKEIRDQINKKTAEMLEEQQEAQNNAENTNPEETAPAADENTESEQTEQPTDSEQNETAE